MASPESSVRRVIRPLLTGVAVTLLICSCGPAYLAPPVTPKLVKVSRSPVSSLNRGYEVHQAKCAKCHSFQDPSDFEIEELTEEIMPDMARKSKLDPADEKAVLHYLLAARQVPPPASP